MQRKSRQLAGLPCAAHRCWEPFRHAGLLQTTSLWLKCGSEHPILGKAECPVAQGPEHSQPGQRRRADFSPHLVTEEPLLVLLFLSTGCHCRECGSL